MHDRNVSDAIEMKPNPIEVTRLAAHEPDHDLRATNRIPDDTDSKLPVDEPVIGMHHSLGTHTKEELINIRSLTHQY